MSLKTYLLLIAIISVMNLDIVDTRATYTKPRTTTTTTYRKNYVAPRYVAPRYVAPRYVAPSTYHVYVAPTGYYNTHTYVPTGSYGGYSSTYYYSKGSGSAAGAIVGGLCLLACCVGICVVGLCFCGVIGKAAA